MPFVDSELFTRTSSAWRAGRCCSLSDCSRRTKASSTCSTRLPDIVAEFPDVVYIVLGATHPNELRERGRSLSPEPGAPRQEEQGREERHFLQSLRRAGGTEGVHRRGGSLHYAVSERSADHFGHAGLCVWRGQSRGLDPVLARGGTAGRRSRCPGAVRATRRPSPMKSVGLLRDERAGMRCARTPTSSGATWSGATSRDLYMDSFEQARLRRRSVRRPKRLRRSRRWMSSRTNLPALKLDHLSRMTDSTGIFQHAIFTVPNFRRRLLHRRQCPRLHSGGAAGRVGRSSGARPGAGHHLCRVSGLTPSIPRAAVSIIS